MVVRLVWALLLALCTLNMPSMAMQRRAGEPRATVKLPRDDPPAPRFDLKKEKTHIISPDTGPDDGIHLSNHIRLTVDHNLKEKFSSNGNEKPKIQVTAPSSNSLSPKAAGHDQLPSAQGFRFQAQVAGWNYARFKLKNCTVSSQDKVSATRNVKNWPVWKGEWSIEENIVLQKTACLSNDYALLGGFCFDATDLDAPWCYWPQMNCDIEERTRISASHLVLDYPAYGSDKQKESCRESGFCYETGARPACYLPKI